MIASYHIPGTPEWLWWGYSPWLLLLLLALPLLWIYWGRRANHPAVRFSGLSLMRSAAGRWSVRARRILPVLRTVALACLIVAAARPQRADQSTSIYTEGIAIQMVVDTSSSMQDHDLSPRGRDLTRLDVVKQVFRRFVLGDEELPGRPNDLIGMIRFARYADSVCPLTVDHDSLIDVLDQTRIVRSRTEDGTAIGDGLALAVERMRELKRITGSGEQFVISSRIAILLTDGEHNIGEVTPEQAGELAALHGIKVYTILAGTGQGGGMFGRRPVNDKALKRIAEVTGGKHFRAKDTESLARIYAEIDELERTKTEERRFARYGELSFWWLIVAFSCLGLQTFLDATRLRKIP